MAKKVRFPLNEEKKNFTTPMDDMMGLFDQTEDQFKEIGACFMKDAYRRESGDVPPSTLSADKLFLEDFVTEEMSWEFGRIAYEFLKHRFDRLDEFDRVAWYDNTSADKSDSESAFQLRVLNLIYNGTKLQDQYCIDLMKYLYKTFHKKEYKQLKRFSKISASELLSLSDDEYGSSITVMSRILCMCPILGIELDDRCSVFYLILDKKMAEIEAERDVEYLVIPKEMFQECLATVLDWEDAEEESNSQKKGRKHGLVYEKLWDMQRFINMYLSYEGFSSEFIFNEDFMMRMPSQLLARTLAILKLAYPKREFTYEDVQTYAQITRLLYGITTHIEEEDLRLCSLLGLDTDYYEDEDMEFLFDPNAVQDRKETQKKPAPCTVNIAPVKKESANADEYLAEIAALRNELQRMKKENNALKSELSQTNVRMREMQQYVADMENDKEELIALRNAMYALSEEYIEPAKETLDEMRAFIKEKKVVIIGGNDNWTKKLKTEFPEWKFVSPNASGNIDKWLVNYADMVYFFTDTLCHGNYYRFVQLMREKGIPYSYMHGVNIANNITQIYTDLKEV